MKGLLLAMFVTYAVTVIHASTADSEGDAPAFSGHNADKRASWLDMKRGADYDPKRASWLDMKRASWLDMKRADENAMKRASWLDMKRAGSEFDVEDNKRASWLDMKRASWLDMKRDAEKRASWLDMKRSVGDDHTTAGIDNDQHRREVALMKDELDRLYSRAIEKGTLDNEGLKLLREMLLRKELISPSALRKIQEKLAEIKSYRKQHQHQQ